MGYTHYWYTPNELDAAKWKAFVADVEKILSANIDVPLAGPDGFGKPEVSHARVALNGRSPKDYESFVIERTLRTPVAHNGLHFSFCKTAALPYDDVATAILIALKHHFGQEVSVSSDGGWDDWRAGEALYVKATDREAVCPFAEDE